MLSASLNISVAQIGRNNVTSPHNHEESPHQKCGILGIEIQKKRESSQILLPNMVLINPDHDENIVSFQPLSPCGAKCQIEKFRGHCTTA
jgi:hypothetical protein